MASNISRPSKYLKHSDEHFQGYWIQLQSLIRQNSAADELLDGLLENPLDLMRQAADCWEGKPVPADNTADLWPEFCICRCVRTLCETGGFGISRITFPPTEKVSCITQYITSKNGTL